MALFAFATGLTLRRGEQLLEFRRELENGHIQFEDPLTGRIYNWAKTKIFRDIHSKEIVVFRGDLPQQQSQDKKTGKDVLLVSSLDSLPEKFRAQLERRLDYITTCRKQGLTKGCRKRIGELITRIAARRHEAPPSTSAVMQWWRMLDENDHYPGALVSGNLRRKRNHRLTEEMLELTRRILRKEYFTRARHPLTRAHLLVNRALKSNGPAGIKQDLTISLSTVRRIANEVTPYHRDLARFGSAYARNKWRYSLKGTMTSRVLERVEIDHTLLDVVVVCDRSGLPLGRPTITVVIDAHSNYIIGFFISFWGTGIGPTLNALKVAISPKDHYCEGKSGLSHPWMGYGLCELIVVDNGLEFHSRQFKLAAWQLNADIQYCAVRQPWLKPSIERHMGNLGLYLPSAGRVHKPMSNYIPDTPRETACITFSQLCNALLKCFVDILPFQPNARTLVEPFEVFKEGFEKLPPPLLPSSFEELDLIFAMSKTMTVGNEGVLTEYLRYNSTQLQTLRRQTGHSFKTRIKFHPEDLSHIYVQDPATKQWLCAPSCHPQYTENLSIVQHRAIRNHLKGQLNKRNALETLVRGKLELIDLYDGFLRGSKGKKNIKTAQQFGALTSTQSLTAASEKTSPIGNKPPLIAEAELEIEPRQIPSFKSFQLD